VKLEEQQHGGRFVLYLYFVESGRGANRHGMDTFKLGACMVLVGMR
jgi:hypothetical protein